MTMTPKEQMSEEKLNTDREIWRREGNNPMDPDNYYQPKISVTRAGGISIDVGGTVITLPVERWHELAKERMTMTPKDKMSEEIKVFKLNDYEWWFAPSLAEAIEDCMKTTGRDREEVYDPDVAYELTPQDLEAMTIRLDEEGEETCTGAEELEFVKKKGEKCGYFCGTES